MVEIKDDLDEIKREIIESRGLVIKATNQSSTHSADLRAIARRQLASDKRLVLNSAAAYAIFVLALFVVVKFAWDNVRSEVRGEAERKASDLSRVQKELEEIRKRDDGRARAELKAAQFYELVQKNRRAEVVEAYDALRKEPLSKTEQMVAADAVERARTELATLQYEQAKEKLRLERFQEAATLLEQALKYKGDGGNAPSMRLALAITYRKMKRAGDAIPHLIAITESAIDREVEDDALYQLAFCYMDTESWNDAKNTWRDLIRRFPDSHFTPEGKMQLAGLNMLH